MPSENITIRSGINPSKVMGSAHAAGSSLEERVGNNERKITLLKNIINYKDSLLPIPKPEESDNTNLNISDRLNNIGEALGVIGGLFKLQLSSLQDKEEKDRQDKAEEDKKLRESNLEAKKQDKKKKKDTGFKVPGMGILGTLKKFFTNVALGAVSLKLLDWLKDDDNQKKMFKVADWLTKNGSKIFQGLLILATIDIATRLLTTAMGISAVMGWMGTIPLLIGGILLSLWALGAFNPGLGKQENIVVKELSRMGGPTEENRQVLAERYRTELKDASLMSKLKGEKKVLKDRIRFLETSEFGEGGVVKMYNWETGEVTKTGGMFTDLGSYVKNKAQKERNDKKKKKFAAGGRPPVGEVVSVGEMGRELFVTDTSGTIISNDKTEHVFDGGALLVAKSSTMDKVSSISQRVDRKRTPNLIDLRGKSGGSSSNPTFTTGDQLSSVPSEDTSNIDLVSGSLVYGLVG